MLSEIDINDMLNLYELDRDSLFKLYNPDKKQVEEQLFMFHYIDGMYSLCKDMAGGVYHFAAWTKVFKV